MSEMHDGAPYARTSMRAPLDPPPEPEPESGWIQREGDPYWWYLVERGVELGAVELETTMHGQEERTAWIAYRGKERGVGVRCTKLRDAQAAVERMVERGTESTPTMPAGTKAEERLRAKLAAAEEEANVLRSALASLDGCDPAGAVAHQQELAREMRAKAGRHVRAAQMIQQAADE